MPKRSTPYVPDYVDDSDRVDCPFCGKMLYPGTRTALTKEWIWEVDVCEHTLFLASDFSGNFEYTSKLFDRDLSSLTSDSAELPCLEEVIQKISHPGLQLRSYDDGTGMDTFGFVPQNANGDDL